MPDIVVDSSVAAKWILPESDSLLAQRLFSEAVTRGDRLVVLDLALAEIANAIWKQHHRGLATLERTHQFLDDLLLCPVQVERSQLLLRPAMDIAVNHGRSIYDALFVALAANLGLPGVTADEPLYRAVQ
jgi:predicted nucleic acid-binding protein